MSGSWLMISNLTATHYKNVYPLMRKTYHFVGGHNTQGEVMKKNIVLRMAVIGIAAAVMAAACGGASALAGQWAITGEQASGNYPDAMELLQDGTGVFDGYEGTWKAEKGRFYVTLSVLGVTFTYDYKLQGKNLTFTDDDGVTLTYGKK
jgi:hypothetical protein